MPDNLPQPGTPAYNLLPKWLQYSIGVVVLLQAIVTSVAAVWTHQTAGKVDGVERIEKVQANQVEKELEKVKAMRVNLWNSWKQLEWLAEVSGKQGDKDKAAEAGRIYQEFVRLHNGE